MMKQRWIPTSERYPNHAGEYIVTAEKNGQKEVGILRFVLKGRKKEPTFYNPFYQEPVRVLAWMKIPEPFEEGRARKRND